MPAEGCELLAPRGDIELVLRVDRYLQFDRPPNLAAWSGEGGSSAVLEGGKAALKFPLLASLFARCEEGGAARTRISDAQNVGRACFNGTNEAVFFTPNAGAGKEAVLQADAHHLL